MPSICHQRGSDGASYASLPPFSNGVLAGHREIHGNSGSLRRESRPIRRDLLWNAGTKYVHVISTIMIVTADSKTNTQREQEKRKNRSVLSPGKQREVFRYFGVGDRA